MRGGSAVYQRIPGDVANLGPRSISEIRFEQPVQPGDWLVVYGEVLNKEKPCCTDAQGYLDYELSVEVECELVLVMVSNLVVSSREE